MRFGLLSFLVVVTAVSVIVCSVYSSRIFDSRLLNYKNPAMPNLFRQAKSKAPFETIKLEGFLMDQPKWKTGVELYRYHHRRGWERSLDIFLESGEVEIGEETPIENLPIEEWSNLHASFAWNAGRKQFQQDVELRLDRYQIDQSKLRDLQASPARSSYVKFLPLLFLVAILIMVRARREGTQLKRGTMSCVPFYLPTGKIKIHRIGDGMRNAPASTLKRAIISECYVIPRIT